jgi:hypothetical protein
MQRKRQTGRTLPDYEKKSGFVAPDRRRGADRSAAHRYMPEERAVRTTERMDYTMEFRARWWPAESW